MNLYQYTFGYQPHYVVAEDFGDAEKTIKTGYPGCVPVKIECHGAYIGFSRKVRLRIIEDGVAEEEK